MDRLSELQALAAVVEAGSFTQAARRLRRSPPAVTRIVAELEARVGVRLIERNPRRCVPTETGRRLARQAASLLADYEEAIAEAAGEAAAPRGALRVTAPLVFGRDHVAPAVMGFLDAHPAITIELDLSDRVQDLLEGNFDLAVRIGAVADGSLVARRVGEVRLVLVASPAYLAAHGVPRVPQDIVGHRLIQHSSRADLPWRFEDAAGTPVAVAVSPHVAVNQADVAVAAAREGRGLVRALSYQVARDVAEGRLVRVLRAYEPAAMPVRLVWPESRRLVRRVRLFVDHVAPVLSALPVVRADPP